MIIGYTYLTDVSQLQAMLEQYTCPNDGYVHAWQDSLDPLLVWIEPSCPVDAIVTNLKVNIGNFVNNAYNYQTDKNPYIRIRKIIDAVRDASVNWLRSNQDVSEDIATFLSESGRLQTWIIDELKAQGAMA